MGEIVSIKDHKKKKRKLKRPFGKKKKKNSQAKTNKDVVVYRNDFGEDVVLPKRKRRRAGSIKWVFITLLLLLCLVAGYSFSQSSFFTVQEIVVSGNSKVTSEKLIKLSGINKNEHIYEANTTRAETIIKTNNWIADVKVTRQLPDTIKIMVAERTPIAAISTANGLVTIDKSGIMLEQKKLLDGLPLMIVTGVDDIATQPLPGRHLESEKAATGLAVILQMSNEAASIISELNVKNTQNIVARTTYGIKIILGDKNNFLEKYNIAKQIMQSEEAKGNLSKIEYIDVSIEEQPTLRFFKVKPGEDSDKGKADNAKKE